MISSTQWTWVWANSGRWWKTGKPGVPQTMVLQTVRHHWETEQQAYFCHGSPVHTWQVWLCMLYKSIFCLPLMLSLWAPHWSLNTIKFWSPAVNLALFLYPQTSTYIFSFNQDTFSLSDYSSVWETGRHWFVMQEAGLLDRGPERKGKTQVLSPTRWGVGVTLVSMVTHANQLWSFPHYAVYSNTGEHISTFSGSAGPPLKFWLLHKNLCGYIWGVFVKTIPIREWWIHYIR